MDLNQIRDMAMKNEKDLSAFDKWAEGVEKRLSVLEQASNVLVEVRLSMERLTSSNTSLGEKLGDMKSMLEKINHDNEQQHKGLSDRIKKLEEAPGDKWNKAVWIITTAALMAASAGLTKLFAP